MNDIQRYHINQRLDEPRRVIGMTLDEGVPMIALFILGFLIHFPVAGLIASAGAVALIKWVKRGQGTYFLLNICYWHSIHWVSRGVLIKIPPAEKRFWLG